MATDNHPDDQQDNEDRAATFRGATASRGGLQAGLVIGKYQLELKVGRGGMGEVWMARNVKVERTVALKLVPPEIQHATEEMARVQETFKRIEALQHQHICPVYDLDEDPRFGWYVSMKYIVGQPLKAYRNAYAAGHHDMFPVEQVVKVLRPVAEALDYAHSQRVLHRDVKPDNILVVGDAEDIQVVDFGLAAEIRGSNSRISQAQTEISGTRNYMAPEQWRGQRQDARTDQYALAVVAYELLSGRVPFESEDFQMQRACVLQDPPERLSDQPEAVVCALLRGLAKRPEERFNSCQELIAALEGSTVRQSGSAAAGAGKPAAAGVVSNSLGMKLALIPAGEFLMGSPDSERECLKDERPQHRVRIRAPFCLAQHAVTVGQFRQFATETAYLTDAEKGEKKGALGWDAKKKKLLFHAGFSWREPGFEQTDEFPVVNVSWNDAVAFCQWLSQKEGKAYRLPTEAEWEYACRAGTITRYYNGDDPENLSQIGNTADAPLKGKCPELETVSTNDGYIFSAPVGQFEPNAFGLYDMHGNVWEWCADWYGDDYYAVSPLNDPRGPDSGRYRVLRGGAWIYAPNFCRSASRNRGMPFGRDSTTGLRVARDG